MPEDRDIDHHSPRAVSALLSRALTFLGVIQPPGLRDPVGDILRAGIEMCVTSGPSLLGKPIENTIRLAKAVVYSQTSKKVGINVTSAETPEDAPLKSFLDEH